MASDETTAHDLVVASEPSAGTPPRRIAERRVVGWATVARLVARRSIRPAGNSRSFWAHREDDDPFLPAPPRERSGSPGLDPVPSVGRTEGSRLQASPPPAPAAAAPPPAPARPRALEPTPAVASGKARPRSPDEVPRPKAAAPSPRPTSPAAPVDRTPPLLRQATPVPSRRPRGRRAPPPEPARARTIDDYVAFLGDLQQAEREYRDRRAEQEREGAPRRTAGLRSGLDDVVADHGEGRVRIPRPTVRREEG